MPLKWKVLQIKDRILKEVEVVILEVANLIGKTRFTIILVDTKLKT